MAPYDSTWVSLDAMATIKEIRSDHYRIPLPVALSDSTHGMIEGFELITVRVRDGDGAEGVGYTYTVGTGGAAVHALIARDLAPLLAGRDAERIEELWQAMWWALHYGGRGGAQALAMSAVDIALWDLRAPAAGDAALAAARRLRSARALLRRRHRPRVPARRAAAPDRRQPRPRLSRDQDEGRARRRCARTSSACAPCAAHLGPGFPLMVDANMRWSVDEAIRAARALRDLDPVWLEEPTIPDDVPGHVRIVREGGLPIAAGENLHTLYEFRALIAAGGVTFPEPDVTNCGGVTVFMKVCHLAEAFNLPVTSHGAHDITVHLLAAVPNRSYLEAHGFGLDRYIAEPLRIEDGLRDRAGPARPRRRVRLEGAGAAARRVSPPAAAPPPRTSA